MIKFDDYKKVTEETKKFLYKFVEDNSFYGNLLSLVQNGESEIKMHRKVLKRKIDEDWVNAIEDALPALDSATRHPSKYIEELEEIKPIELSHSITSRSIRHLAQHSDFISKIEGDEITPSKILNCYNEETLQTYENKFVNTLIQRLYIFISKRYSQMIESGKEDSCDFDFTSSFDDGKYKGDLHFGVSVTRRAVGKKDDVHSDYAILERVKKLNMVAITYLNCEFVKEMGQSYVRPPIMRTNAITKNKDLKELLNLWEFIESYEKIGYTISVEESAEKPNEEFLDDLYTTMAMQYAVFRYNLTRDSEALETVGTDEPIEPHYVTELVEIQKEEFDIFDTEYKKIIPTSLLNSRRKLSKSELDIREALTFALAADKVLVAQAEREEKVIIKQQQKEEAKRLSEELAKKSKELARELKRKPNKLEAKIHEKKSGIADISAKSTKALLTNSDENAARRLAQIDSVNQIELELSRRAKEKKKANKA